ncbi:hypothetical protein KAFR_0C03140 [Kazachstania africana CBS 2517]|uniref:C2H2-type domain-containing protein n=1 Tax=Kazachstania africana (strain ATCC 22294 / BCRC 22015 / CBS 2517 / CECT 1963 / NBRC 1671 / NRRL Y-8276) TaxID=1071382 RepID=H2ASF6_KAZAF|nr:hypothetical protein KAFR_0C03140 [Kazachstania africana CBS 2517]CCF57306.1 hypothetical protein KAFR_0C03140 [Kazachstania africana CBS 2517]
MNSVMASYYKTLDSQETVPREPHRMSHTIKDSINSSNDNIPFDRRTSTISDHNKNDSIILPPISSIIPNQTSTSNEKKDIIYSSPSDKPNNSMINTSMEQAVQTPRSMVQSKELSSQSLTQDFNNNNNTMKYYQRDSIASPYSNPLQQPIQMVPAYGLHLQQDPQQQGRFFHVYSQPTVPIEAQLPQLQIQQQQALQAQAQYQQMSQQGQYPIRIRPTHDPHRMSPSEPYLYGQSGYFITPTNSVNRAATMGNIPHQQATTVIPDVQRQAQFSNVYPSGLPTPATIQSNLSLAIRLRKQCPVCGKICSRPSTLKTHYLIHTGDTPFKCPWKGCTKSFNVKSNMLRHFKSHEKKAASKKETEGLHDSFESS